MRSKRKVLKKNKLVNGYKRLYLIWITNFKKCRMNVFFWIRKKLKKFRNFASILPTLQLSIQQSCPCKFIICVNLSEKSFAEDKATWSGLLFYVLCLETFKNARQCLHFGLKIVSYLLMYENIRRFEYVMWIEYSSLKIGVCYSLNLFKSIVYMI